MKIPQLLTYIALLGTSVWALPQGSGSPHFLDHQTTSTISSAGVLTGCWKEAGLGSNELISYTLSADATANYGCFNNGGNHPQATNKETVNGPVAATGQFSSGKNGNINQCLSAGPPSAGAFMCPSGQTRKLICVLYQNIKVTDNINDIVTLATPQQVSVTLISGQCDIQGVWDMFGGRHGGYWWR